jgi:hypothetical protein
MFNVPPPLFGRGGREEREKEGEALMNKEQPYKSATPMKFNSST